MLSNTRAGEMGGGSVGLPWSISRQASHLKMLKNQAWKLSGATTERWAVGKRRSNGIARPGCPLTWQQSCPTGSKVACRACKSLNPRARMADSTIVGKMPTG
jgi:hypothetical protein